MQQRDPADWRARAGFPDVRKFRYAIPAFLPVFVALMYRVLSRLSGRMRRVYKGDAVYWNGAFSRGEKGYADILRPP